MLRESGYEAFARAEQLPSLHGARTAGAVLCAVRVVRQAWHARSQPAGSPGQRV